MIEEGMVLKNGEGDICLSSVEKGRYGLLLKGNFIDDGTSYAAYLPYELEPSMESVRWYDWASIWYVELPSGIKLGSLGLWRGDTCDTIQAYDTKMKETIETIRKEGK